MTTNKDNMRIWDALGKTDPAHTKQFTRAGGFKGTAIKPMWANKQMTEFFGPCGVGWGMDEPQFTVVPALDEIMVFCTVGLWYVQNARSQTLYGVGGDKVLVKQSSGLRTDDEAFKKAYTDALSNAMKFIGVGADVHMGQFDDNKYVQSVAREFEEEKKAEVVAEVERQKVPHPMRPTADAAIPPELDWSYNKASGVLICRVVDVKVAKTKGAKPKEYVAVKINQQIDGKDMAFYWHESHKAELLAAKGKICKFLTLFTDKGFLNIDMVLEISGKSIIQDEPKSVLGDKPLGDLETQARLLASNMDWQEEELRELFGSQCGGSWAKTLEALQRTQAQIEGSTI